jgi:plastocyanin
MVTPSAHDDMKPQAKPAKPVAAAPARVRPAVLAPELQAAPAPAENTIWKKLFLGGLTAVLAVGLFAGINGVVNGTQASPAPIASQVAQATSNVPVVDEAKVAGLMAKVQANPKDIASLQALGDEFYNVGQFDVAATWFDKIAAIDPENVLALLARGAVYFNLNDVANAETTWKKVVAIDPKNIEVHYDLGFLYLNQATPNWTGVQAEWNKVIELDPGSDLARTVQAHLDSLAKSSMIPGASAGANASPAASAAPAASPAANVIDQGAKNLAFTKSTMSAPAGSPFTIRFGNQDALPHDVVIRDASGAEVFKGDLVTGPKTVDYAVPALAAGTYAFGCSIHPNMTGALMVGS